MAPLAADANVLLSASLGKAALRVFTHARAAELSVLTCSRVSDEVARYLPVLGAKYKIPEVLLQSQFRLLAVEVCPPEAYRAHLDEARRRIGARDPDDAELLALALARGALIWTNDRDFEGCGVRCVDTARLLKTLDDGGF